MSSKNISNEKLRNLIASKFASGNNSVIRATLETVQHKNGGYGRDENNYTFSYSYIVCVEMQNENKNTTKMSYEFDSLEDLLMWFVE